MMDQQDAGKTMTGLLSEGLEGEPHTYRCSTSGTGEMAVAQVLRKGELLSYSFRLPPIFSAPTTKSLLRAGDGPLCIEPLLQ